MQYQPNNGEIRSALGAMTANHPQLDARAQRAEAILYNLDITFAIDSWYVPSAREPDTKAYKVTSDGCTCPDFAGVAPVVDGRKLCKHRLAVDALTAVLTAQLNYYPSLSVDFEFNVVTETGEKICRCQELADTSIIFERSHDAAAFAEWLHSVPAVRIPSEMFTEWGKDQNYGVFYINTETGDLQNA